MNNQNRLLLSSIFLATCFTNAHAVTTFGAKVTGSDLEPTTAFLENGGEGATSASVNFATFQAQAGFDPSSIYLPVLRAKSEGLDATFDDDRTQAAAMAYQAFTSSITQTINLDIILDSIVTNDPFEGTSGVLSDIYVYGGANFEVRDGFCNSGRFTFDSIYLCGDQIATSSRNGGKRSNLFNGGSDPTLTDTLSFTVNAGESFGIFASLTAGSYKGTADAFNTLTLDFTTEAGGDLAAISPVTAVPLPGALWLFSTGLLGLMGYARASRTEGA